MPVSPARQKELRDRKKDLEELPVKRCANCPKMFRQKTKWQKFCSDKCRREFHTFGSSYGRLKEHLEKLIREEVERQCGARLKLMSEGFAALEARVSILASRDPK